LATFLAGLTAAGSEPTDAQLGRYQARTTAALGRLTAAAPPPVVDVADRLADAVRGAEGSAGLGAAFRDALGEVRDLSTSAGKCRRRASHSSPASWHGWAVEVAEALLPQQRQPVVEANDFAVAHLAEEDVLKGGRVVGRLLAVEGEPQGTELRPQVGRRPRDAGGGDRIGRRPSRSG